MAEWRDDINGQREPICNAPVNAFCLYGKYTFNSSANGSSQQVAQNIALNADYPVMVFIRTTNTAQPTPVISYRNGGNVYVAGLIPITRASR